MLRLCRSARRWLPLPAAAALGATVWLLWPAPAPTALQAAHPHQAASPAPYLQAVAPPAALVEEGSDGDGTRSGPVLDWRDPATQERFVEAVAQHCPWPPHPASWHVLDGPCLMALDRFYLTDNWRRVLVDPVGTHQAVVAALDDPECRPHDADAQQRSWNEWPRWRGEPRPDLLERCAGDAMVRLAKLQQMCIPRLHRRGISRVDEYDAYIRDIDDLGAERDWDQESYLRIMAAHHSVFAGGYWADHMCRSVPAIVFDWLDQLLEPPGDQVRSLAVVAPNTQPSTCTTPPGASAPRFRSGHCLGNPADYRLRFACLACSWLEVHGTIAPTRLRSRVFFVARAAVPTIVFVQPDRTRQTLAGVVGRSIMDCAVDNGVPGIRAQCGGGCTCSTCHGFVDETWFDRVGAPVGDEADILDFVPGRRVSSRLTCQIVVRDDLDGIVIHVPPPE